MNIDAVAAVGSKSRTPFSGKAKSLMVEAFVVDEWPEPSDSERFLASWPVDIARSTLISAIRIRRSVGRPQKSTCSNRKIAEDLHRTGSESQYVYRARESNVPEIQFLYRFACTISMLQHRAIYVRARSSPRHMEQFHTQRNENSTGCIDQSFGSDCYTAEAWIDATFVADEYQEAGVREEEMSEEVGGEEHGTSWDVRRMASRYKCSPRGLLGPTKSLIIGYFGALLGGQRRSRTLQDVGRKGLRRPYMAWKGQDLDQSTARSSEALMCQWIS
jgi:hypothetical protein